jgi:predicted phage tail protein
MLRSRILALIVAAAIVLALGGAALAAPDKAGSVQATSSSACDDPGSQTVTISGEIYVWLHNPDAVGFPVAVTYHKTGTVDESTLSEPICTSDGWSLYDTGLTTSDLGAASVQVWDSDGKSVGGDSFLSV